jgi:hypothetical protein
MEERQKRTEQDRREMDQQRIQAAEVCLPVSLSWCDSGVF